MNGECPICDLPLGDDESNIRPLGDSPYKVHGICLDIIESALPTNDNLHEAFSA